MKYLRAIIIQAVIVILGFLFCYFFWCPGEVESVLEEDTPNKLAIIGIFWVVSSFVQLSTSLEIWLCNIGIGIIMVILGIITTTEGFFASLIAVAFFMGFVAYVTSAFNNRLSALLMIIAIVIGIIGWKFKDYTEPTDEKERIERREEKERDEKFVRNEWGIPYYKDEVVIIKNKIYQKGRNIIEINGKWKIVPEGYIGIKYDNEWHMIPMDQDKIYDNKGQLIAEKHVDGIWWIPSSQGVGFFDTGWDDYKVYEK